MTVRYQIFLCLLLIFSTGCSNSQNSTQSPLPTTTEVSDPVTWITVKGVEYYYYPSTEAIDENTLHFTGELTDSDDAVEAGIQIYSSDNFKDSYFIKIESDGSWLEYKFRDKKK